MQAASIATFPSDQDEQMPQWNVTFSESFFFQLNQIEGKRTIEYVIFSPFQTQNCHILSRSFPL